MTSPLETQIHLSDNETKYLKLRTGRCNADQLDANQLVPQIFESEYDIVRLRVPSKDETVVSQLESIGFPYHFSGGIRRYKVNVFENPIQPFNNPSVEFELYDGKKRDLVKEIIDGTWGVYPIGYYKTPYLNRLINKEMESECLSQFYLNRNDHSQHEDAFLWMLKDKGEYVGFIALYEYEDSVDSTIAGILKPYRKSGYFYDILRHIRTFCRNRNRTYFLCGARNENPYSQRAFEGDFMIGYAVEYVFHIPSLLNHSEISRIESPIKSDRIIGSSLEFIHSQAMPILETKKLKGISNTKYVPAPGIDSFQHSGTIDVGFPVVAEDEVLAVAKLYNEDRQLKGIIYQHWQ